MNKLFLLILTFIMMCFSVVGCAESAKWEYVTASFSNEGGKQTQPFNLAVAKNDKERQQGLMYLKSMPSNAGMIFIYPDEQVRHFWMRNTYISLDIIFINENFSVVGIAPRTKTLSDETISVLKPSKYIVELNAGIAEKLGIKEGSVLKPLQILPEGEW